MSITQVIPREHLKRYSHHCTDCVFLGQFQEFDLYYCSAPRSNHPTVLAVFGVGGDYHSGLNFGWGQMEELVEARKRAQALGFDVRAEQYAPDGELAGCLYGLSLSFCVKDILEGETKEADVRLIYAGTNCRSQADWDDVLAQYRRVYWVDYPEEGEKLARRLLAAGKVVQLKVNGRPLPDISGGAKIWAASAADIRWRE
jgi:hypothetical protein